MKETILRFFHSISTGHWVWEISVDPYTSVRRGREVRHTYTYVCEKCKYKIREK